MPNVDSSDYIRRLKLTAIRNANNAANRTKFRALTTFDSYDPSLMSTRPTGEVCNDSCRSDVKPHNLTNLMSLSYKNVSRAGLN